MENNIVQCASYVFGQVRIKCGAVRIQIASIPFVSIFVVS